MEWDVAAIGNSKGNIGIAEEAYILEPGSRTGTFHGCPGTVRIQSKTGSLGDSEDSFLFCYTRIYPDKENFLLSATCRVKETSEYLGWQAGYGLFAVDTVISESRHHRYRNILTVGRHRMSKATEHSAGMRVVAGYQKREATEVSGKRKVDLSREAGFSNQKERICSGEQYHFVLEKTDLGFTGRILFDGEEKELSIEGCDFLTKQDSDAIYVGFAAAGDLELEISDIHFEITQGKSSKTPEDAIQVRLPDYPFARDAILEPEKIHADFRKKIYVSPTGRPDGKGKRNDPTDLQTALSAAGSGQTIIMLDGIYMPETSYYVSRRNSRDEKNVLHLLAEHPGRAYIDGAQMVQKLPTFILRDNGWHIRGIVFRNSPLSGLLVCGSNNTIERCEAYGNGDTGILICSYPGTKKDEWPGGNTVIGCDSHHNCDTAGENADGFGAKLSIGEGNVFYECTAHHNVDDGFDLFSKNVLGTTGRVTIENCVAYENGRSFFSVSKNKSGGMGFKLGGDNVAIAHRVWNSIAFRNQEAGFSTNYNPWVRLKNTTAWQNGKEPVLYNYYLFTRRSDIPPDWKVAGLFPENNVFTRTPAEVSWPEAMIENNRCIEASAASSELERVNRNCFISPETAKPILRGRDGLIKLQGQFTLRKECLKKGGADLDERSLFKRLRRKLRYHLLLKGAERDSGDLVK